MNSSTEKIDSYTVFCSTCYNYLVIDLTSKYDDDILDGWRVDSSGCMYCPKCLGKKNDSNKR